MSTNTAQLRAPHNMTLGYRVVHPDFRSSNGFRWPWPGEWAEPPLPAGSEFSKGGDGCPTFIGDGLCVAITPEGAASGGIRLSTVLIVGYYEADVLARSATKLRVKRALVLDVWDFNAVLIQAARSRADLSGACLSGAYLSGADLSGANLSGAYLSGAFANDYTTWPAGFDAKNAGVIS